MPLNIIITDYQQISSVSDLSKPLTGLTKHIIGNNLEWIGRISPKTEKNLTFFLSKYPHYKKLDRTVQLALFCSDTILLPSDNKNLRIGVNIGSSRGATHILEEQFSQFLKTNEVNSFTSPYTSLGNISSWVGQHLKLNGIQFSHSMTCSTSLLSIANGVAWLTSGMADKMLVGGAESSLTPFTLAQSKALRIYSKEQSIPCLAGNMKKTSNTMVLGEGVGLLLLEKENEYNINQKIARIAGIGYASEPLSSATGISKQGENFQESMKMALEQSNTLPSEIDAIITHTPGTYKGDIAEMNAISKVFTTLPFITNNKWKIGHTFGASGALSLIYGIEMLKNNTLYPSPWDTIRKVKKQINSILINAAGFGGNAVSILLKN